MSVSTLENYIADGEFDPEAPPERIEEGKTYFGHITDVEISDWVENNNQSEVLQKNIKLVFRSPGVSGAIYKTYFGIFEQKGENTVLAKKGGNELADRVWYLLKSLSDAGVFQKGQETVQIGQIESIAKGAPVQFSVNKNNKGYLDISQLKAWPEGSRIDNGLPF